MKKYSVYSKSARSGAKLIPYGYDEGVARIGYRTELRWYEMMGYKQVDPPQDVLEYIMSTEGILECAYFEGGDDIVIVELKVREEE